MDINNVIKSVQNKFGYTESQTNFLKMILPKMIEYYGEEFREKIINTILNVPIIYVNNDEEIQKSATKLGVKGKYRLSKSADSVYEEFFQKNGYGKIERIPFIIVRNNNNKNNTDVYLSCIVHELCHAIMNYDKSVIIENSASSKTGFSENKTIFYGNIKNHNMINLEIEEGLNEYDAIRITEMILDRKIKSCAYLLYVSYVSSLMNNEYLRKVINTSRLNGDDKWKEIVGEEIANEFVESLMNYSNLLFTFADNESAKKAKEKRLENLKTILIQTYNKMTEFGKKFNPYSNEHTK